MDTDPSQAENAATSRLEAIERKLDQLLEHSARADRRYLTIADAAAYADLSEESIRRLLARGKLTALRPVAGRVLIDRRELDSLILASKRAPVKGKGRGVYARNSNETTEEKKQKAS